MRNDQIFVLLLVILLPMSGCFDGAVGDAEGTDDASENGDSSGGEGTSTGTTSSTQARTWYSSGDAVKKYWNDGQDAANGGTRCLEYGPSYDPDTGEYLGDECKETGYPQSMSDWNGTNCVGTLDEVGSSYPSNPRYAPSCKVVATTISTNAGEALILYEMQSITITSTCDGVLSSSITQIGGYYGGEDNAIVPGSALSCVHEVSFTQSYVPSSYSTINDMKIWSLVYAIQDTTVV